MHEDKSAWTESTMQKGGSGREGGGVWWAGLLGALASWGGGGGRG